MRTLKPALRIICQYYTYYTHWYTQAALKMSTSSKPKVYISRRIPEKAKAMIDAECDVKCSNSDEPPPRSEYLSAVKDIDGLFCLLTDKIDAELLDAAGPNLRVLSTMSVGYEHIDLKECARRNIIVGYTPDILSGATAELTVALLLATSRRLKEAMQAVISGEWGTWKPMWLCGPGLEGSTVGIVGMGRIGLTVGKCLTPFGVTNFLYHNRKEKAEAKEIGAKLVTFDELLEKSDFVVSCVAFSSETKNMFDANAFRKMKKTAIFVNTSRGGVVNQDDLLAALQSGEIGAAGLDVTTPEPLPTDSALLKLNNCVILPHIGSATHKTREAMGILAARNLLAGLKGEKLPAQLQ